MSIFVYKTKSGSTYEVHTPHPELDSGTRGKVRKLNSGAGQEGRLTSGQDWRDAEDFFCKGVGERLAIYWGNGTDEHSPEIPVECQANNTRWTFTSEVVSITEKP